MGGWGFDVKIGARFCPNLNSKEEGRGQETPSDSTFSEALIKREFWASTSQNFSRQGRRPIGYAPQGYK